MSAPDAARDGPSPHAGPPHDGPRGDAAPAGGRHAASLGAAYFDRLYAASPDPWGFATSPYEIAKYDATLAALPRPRYARALEVGCSIGVLTARLALRCARLLAIDPSPGALARARERLAAAGAAGVTLAEGAVPAGWPDPPAGAPYDLVVLSEVLYYLDRADLSRAAARLLSTWAPGGDAVLVHYTGPTDYPLAGDGAAEGFLAALGPAARVLRAERAEGYRLDVLRRA